MCNRWDAPFSEEKKYLHTQVRRDQKRSPKLVLNGKRDKTRLTGVKSWSVMAMFEGWCASKVSEPAAQCSAECTGAHLKYLYTNAHSMRNKQEEIKALAFSQSCGITGISTAFGMSAVVDGYRHFKRDRQGGQRWEVLLHVKDCMLLATGDDTVGNIWVRRKEKQMLCRSQLTSTQPGIWWHWWIISQGTKRYLSITHPYP